MTAAAGPRPASVVPPTRPAGDATATRATQPPLRRATRATSRSAARRRSRSNEPKDGVPGGPGGGTVRSAGGGAPGCGPGRGPPSRTAVTTPLVVLVALGDAEAARLLAERQARLTAAAAVIAGAVHLQTLQVHDRHSVLTSLLREFRTVPKASV